MKKNNPYAMVIQWISALAMLVFSFSNLSEKSVVKLTNSALILVLTIFISSFLSAIMELKAWHQWLSFLSKPLIKFGNLPKVCGTSFPIAFFSSNAANTMLVTSYREHKINHKDLFTAALCNSWAIMTSHYLRILLPFISAIGLAGILYYSISIGSGLCIVIGFLFTARKRNQYRRNLENHKDETLIQSKPWNEILRLSFKRGWKISLRFATITIPLYFFVATLNKMGFFKVTTDHFPIWISSWCNTAMLSIVAARFGGLLSAAGVAASLIESNCITNSQILASLLLANMVTNPIRAVRRNLPTALGIFPDKMGFKIVLILQTLRFLFSGIAILFLILGGFLNV